MLLVSRSAVKNLISLFVAGIYKARKQKHQHNIEHFHKPGFRYSRLKLLSIPQMYKIPLLKTILVLLHIKQNLNIFNLSSPFRHSSYPMQSFGYIKNLFWFKNNSSVTGQVRRHYLLFRKLHEKPFLPTQPDLQFWQCPCYHLYWLVFKRILRSNLFVPIIS